EEVLDRVLLNALAEALGVPRRVPVPLLPGEQVESDPVSPADDLSRFLAGELAAVCLEPDARVRAEATRPRLLVPGPFSPLPGGQCGLGEVAAGMRGRPAAFELTVATADKPPLADGEVRRRLAAFAWRAPVWLTRAPTFAEKAALFPGGVFAVG